MIELIKISILFFFGNKAQMMLKFKKLVNLYIHLPHNI
jgi:hypothetical protein